MIILNAINDDGNRIVMVDKDTNKDAIKEFLITTLSKCDTRGNFIDTPTQISKLIYDFPEEMVLNITIYFIYNKDCVIGNNILNMADINYGNCPHLEFDYVKNQVDKYWDIIEEFINTVK